MNYAGAIIEGTVVASGTDRYRKNDAHPTVTILQPPAAVVRLWWPIGSPIPAIGTALRAKVQISTSAGATLHVAYRGEVPADD